MAVQEAELLRSINAILESGERKREFDVAKALEYMKLAGSQKEAGQKAALQWMQIKQAKKLQDVQLAGEQIDRLKKTNLQMMTVHANTFIDLSGLNRWYNPEDEDWREEMLDDLQDTDYYGFNEVDAYRIVGAVQSYYLKEPQFILEIASDLNAKMEAGVPDSFVKAFANPKGTNMFVGEKAQDTYQHLANVDKTLLNMELIMAEEFELGKSLDVEIDRDISMADVVTLPSGDATDQAIAAGTTNALSSRIIKINTDIKSKKQQITAEEESLEQLRVHIATAKLLKESDQELTPLQEDLIENETEIIGEREDKIAELSQLIVEETSKGQKMSHKMKDEAIRSGEVAMAPPVIHFGIDPLQKFWYWNRTGIWPSDETLREAEDVAQAKRDKSWQRIEEWRKREQAAFDAQVGRNR